MFARTLFKVKIYSSEGFMFENLFAQVMEYANPFFCKIEPYGNQGDRGNDAYERDAGRYYQVFAPKQPSASKASAIAKAKTDFADKLLPYWGSFCPPKEYIFVFNDKYHGSIVDIERTLSEIKTEHSLLDARVLRSSNLEDIFMNLTPDKIMAIVGGLPSPETTNFFVDYTILGQVIDHILNTPPALGIPEKLISPDFEEKIIFNNLCIWGDSLRAKAREAWQVDDYLSLNSEFAKQHIRDNLSGYYAESLDENFNPQQTASVEDLRFTYILERIAPPSGDPLKDRLMRDASLILMAKYFETCDVFEEPTNALAR